MLDAAGLEALSASRPPDSLRALLAGALRRDREVLTPTLVCTTGAILSATDASESRGPRSVLVDTSAWFEFDRSTGSEVDRHLTRLIAETENVAVSEPVIMEVVAGARDQAREHDLRRLMARFALLRFNAGVDFDAASRIYLSCRRSGITPRGMIDCMIASVALRSDASLLSADADLDRIARHLGIPAAIPDA